MIIKRLYLQPECEVEITSLVDLLCQSPEEGGLEGTFDEDWVI